jgi:hypothetical protein
VKPRRRIVSFPARKARALEGIRDEVASALEPGGFVTGLLAGRCSSFDVLTGLLDKTGPARLTLATWTLGRAEVERLAWMLDSGLVYDPVVVLDKSFASTRGYRSRLLEVLGSGRLAEVETHAKVTIIRNASWDVTIRSSMNANRNNRLEQVDVNDDADIAEHYEHLLRSLGRR